MHTEKRIFDKQKGKEGRKMKQTGPKIKCEKKSKNKTI